MAENLKPWAEQVAAAVVVWSRQSAEEGVKGGGQTRMANLAQKGTFLPPWLPVLWRGCHGCPVTVVDGQRD
jgi:hypothetical protein